jgi:SNF2 family DNA or RNA helicase
MPSFLRPKFSTDLFFSAHIIRRVLTTLLKAMKKLRAKFYWCLTGTPVQNSLEDIAALLSFIRAPPLDDIADFRKYIVAPLTKGSENGVKNLRQLLDSVRLRRTKQLLDLLKLCLSLDIYGSLQKKNISIMIRETSWSN